MILINGNLSEDKISLDSGFFFGRGVFETILVKEKPILLSAHVKSYEHCYYNRNAKA